MSFNVPFSRPTSGVTASGPTVTLGIFECSLLALLLLATAIRVWNLASVPIALHPDELAGWLGVHQILAGKMRPSVFFNYRVLYLPLYGIFEAASSWIFGNNATAFRLPAAILGTATCLGTGLLTYTFTRDRLALLLACGIMAILPWDIAISRVALERAATLPFLLFGLFFLRRGLLQSTGRDILVSFGLLAIGAYSYRAASFDGLVLAVAQLALECKRAPAVRRCIEIGAVMWALLTLPLALSFSSFSGGPVPFTFANGFNTTSLETFFRYYIAHLSPSALFVTGDGNIANAPHFGVLYGWMFPFIVIGLVSPGRSVTRSSRLFLWLWLLIFPLGGALATDGNGNPHFMRTLIGAPLFCTLATLGLLQTRRWLSRTSDLQTIREAVIALLTIVVVVQFGNYCNAYFRRYPAESANAFRYGDKELFSFIKAHERVFDRVCITSLSWWNFTSEVGYYMWDDDFPTIEGLDARCYNPGSLMALSSPRQAPRGARLIATSQRLDGTVRVYFAVP